jgi:hypothetical protein
MRQLQSLARAQKKDRVVADDVAASLRDLGLVK